MRLPLRRHPMHFKKYLIAGLLVWLPLAITVWVLTWLYGVLDGGLPDCWVPSRPWCQAATI